MSRITHYRALMRMDKPIGTWLLAWPTFWALLVAGAGDPSVRLVAIFAAGVFLMRSAGCVINDFADRHIDGHIARTVDRPLATGAVKPAEALILFAVLVFAAFLLVLVLDSLLVLLLSVIAAGLAILYPFTKRITHLPQFVLGAAFSMAIPMAFAAVEGRLPIVAWWLFAANVLWTVAYDTQYAMVDREDDLKVGVKSTAILFGKYDVAIISLLQLGTLILLSVAGWWVNMQWPYWAGLVAMALMFVWQFGLIRGRHPEQCFRAFRMNHYTGMVFTIGLALNYWLPETFTLPFLN